MPARSDRRSGSARAVLLAAILLILTLVPPASGTLRAVGAPAQPPWSWPLPPVPQVVRQFDLPAQPWLPGHRGVDLAAGEGTEVRSPATGRVVFTGWVVDRPVITVDHGDGVLSSFEPVTALTKRGQLVQEGQVIGSVSLGSPPAGIRPAASHCLSGCLHWGVRLHGEYVDPLDYVLDRRPSVLLPLHGP